MRVQSINLNLIPTGVMPIIHLSQYDEEQDGALLFMIYNGTLPYDLTDCTAVIEGTKSDGTFFSYPCTIYSNYITSAVYYQMTALAEDYTGEIRISNGDETIGTLNFTFNIEKAGVSTVDISETEIPELLEEIQTSVDEAAYWAEQASQSAAGVRQWNGRSGSVLPMAGDYNASQITYDNTTSGMTAEDVQAAIDELEARDASDLEYDNTTSGLTATNAQAAIDELATEAQAAEARDGDAYNSATTYGPTDNTSGYPSYCIENSKIYKNIVSCTGVAPSADTSGTYWEETDISTELSSLNSDLTTVSSGIVSTTHTITTNELRKVGKMVSININITLTSNVLPYYNVIMSIPDGFKPYAAIFITALYSNSNAGTSVLGLQIQSSGSIYTSINLPTGTVIAFTATYFSA